MWPTVTFSSRWPPPVSPGDDAATREIRRTSYVEHLGLSEAQGAILLGVADRYRDGLQTLATEARRLAGPPDAAAKPTATQQQDLDNLLQRKRALVFDLIHQLRLELDEQGMGIVHKHIEERVKPNVRFEER